jgi:hypothetical protein
MNLVSLATNVHTPISLINGASPCPASIILFFDVFPKLVLRDNGLFNDMELPISLHLLVVGRAQSFGDH